jgi:ketosteroid isomerase-like protein
MIDDPMSSENSERLSAVYDTLASTGAWESPGLLAADFELRQDPVLDAGRTFHGPGGPGELLQMLEASFRDVVVEAERFVEGGGGDIVAMVRVRGHGRASGIAIDREQAHLWSFDGPTAVRMMVFGDRGEALQAAGLSE